MKIAIITDGYWPDQGGGAYVYTRDLVDGLSCRHDVFVVTRRGLSVKRGKFIKIEVGEKLSCDADNPLLYNFEKQEVYKEAEKALTKIKPDILHFQHFYRYFLPTIALSSKYPTVVTLHDYTLKLLSFILNKPTLGYFLFHPWRIFKTGFLLKKFLPSVQNFHFMKDVKVLIADSRHIEKSYTEACLSNRIVQMYYGIDLSKFKASHKFDKNKILFAGRLVEEKGVEIAIRAIEEIRKRNPSIVLEIAGDGPEKEKLQSLAKKLGLGENVLFLGWLKQEELNKRRSKVNFELIPSLWEEPFGLTGIEAMATGKPVIGSRVGGIPEWLTDGKTGFLVKPGDEEELSERILYLLSQPNLIKQMGKKARIEAEKKFDIKNHVLKMEKIYQEILKNG